MLRRRIQSILLPLAHLPPVGWADVATKRDLDHLAEVIRGELAVVRGEMAAMEYRFEAGLARATLDTRSGLRTLFLGLAGLQTRAPLPWP